LVKKELHMRFIILLLLFSSYNALNLQAQEARPFTNEVNELVAGDSAINKKKVVLFTGSSSIRMWKDLKSYFPKHNVLNRGFGGSQMTDLLYFFDKLVVPYKPKMIFIYEGDNDLASKKNPDEIIATADSILTLIRNKVSKKVKVAFIAAKPSLARWEMKDKYVEFNSKLKAWTATKKNVFFVDVWTPMLAANGEVQKDLFMEDGLHMKKKGYDIWAKEVAKYMP
jgi:lysophospholipase L1-like esterase